MTRIKEPGIEAGARNIGRLALFSIPWVVGAGASVWLGLWITGHNFQKQKEAEKHELSQQERSAVYVGAAELPKGKLAVEMQVRSCLKIVRADVDTKRKIVYSDVGYSIYSLILYGQNKCDEHVNYVAWYWQMLSPNGTVLKQGYTNQCAIPGVGEISECALEIDQDTRAEKFRVWAQITVFQ